VAFSAPERWFTDGLPRLTSRLAQFRRWLPTASLVAAALFTTWVVRQYEADPSRPVVSRDEDPDYFIENFTTTVTDTEGYIKRRLSAQRLLHFPDTDSNELTAPHLVLHRRTGTPWHIQSERGWISASGEVVLLLGRVHAWRDNDRGVRVLDIRTRDMRILPSTEYGETDKPVVIRSRGSETRGVAMRAFLRESRVELLSQVTTTYQKRKDDQ
tara:strand:+ start:165 stop:803 length:639 start_codon:yes stop_codon:yes gene_type:complete